MLVALLWSALAAAPAGARAAAAVVPARIDAALLLDGPQGAAGLRAFLDAVAERAPALAAGPYLSALVGPDILAQPVSWGLAFSGPRALVFARESFALTAPVRDGKAARAALRAWLEKAGPPRPVRMLPLRGLLASGSGRKARAAMVAPMTGSLRLLTASGPHAAALVASLARIGAAKAGTPPLSSDRAVRALLARLTSPAGVFLRGDDPLRAAALSIDASAAGLVARGRVLATAPLLGGEAPGGAACQGASLLCLRAGLGEGGRALLAHATRAYLAALLASAEREAPDRLARVAVTAAERLVLRSDGADLRFLFGDRHALWALRVAAVTAPPPAAGGATADGPRSLCLKADAAAAWFGTPCPEKAPADARPAAGEHALEAQLETAALDAFLARLTAIDAVRGGVPASLYATRLMVGGLLRRSGPIRLTGNPDPAGASIELHWPLR